MVSIEQDFGIGKILLDKMDQDNNFKNKQKSFNLDESIYWTDIYVGLGYDGFFCHLCDNIFSYKNKRTHIESNQHNENIMKRVKGCPFCLQSFEFGEYQSHINSDEHKKNVKKHSNEDLVVRCCFKCNKHIATNVNAKRKEYNSWYSHLNSDAHKNNETKTLNVISHVPKSSIKKRKLNNNRALEISNNNKPKFVHHERTKSNSNPDTEKTNILNPEMKPGSKKLCIICKVDVLESLYETHITSSEHLDRCAQISREFSEKYLKSS